MTTFTAGKAGVFIPASHPSLSIPFQIQKSRRKTWALTIGPDKALLMKIPLSVSYDCAETILHTKERWIVKKYMQLTEAQNHIPKSNLTQTQRSELENRYRQAAKKYFPARVAYYENIIGVTHGSISIRDQKTRWGSCSAKGNLNFNWRLMLAPPRVLDYVVVHELCHRKQMNHSKAFWDAVEMVLPDYRELRKWLQDNGRTLVL